MDILLKKEKTVVEVKKTRASIAELGAKARIVPKGNLSLKAKGFKAWRDMLIEFTRQTESWLKGLPHTINRRDSEQHNEAGQPHTPT